MWVARHNDQSALCPIRGLQQLLPFPQPVSRRVSTGRSGAQRERTILEQMAQVAKVRGHVDRSRQPATGASCHQTAHAAFSRLNLWVTTSNIRQQACRRASDSDSALLAQQQGQRQQRSLPLHLPLGSNWSNPAPATLANWHRPCSADAVSTYNTTNIHHTTFSDTLVLELSP